MFTIINTVAALATLVVLAAAAIAALIQLSHLRASNQLQALIDIYSRAGTSEMAELFDKVSEIPQMLQTDTEYLKRVSDGTVSFRNNPLILGLWYDEVGIALRQRLVPPSIIFQMGTSAWRTVRDWQTLLPLIEATRKRTPAAFIHFEYAAVKAKQWLDGHPHGDYPPDTPRWSSASTTR